MMNLVIGGPMITTGGRGGGGDLMLEERYILIGTFKGRQPLKRGSFRLFRDQYKCGTYNLCEW